MLLYHMQWDARGSLAGILSGRVRYDKFWPVPREYMVYVHCACTPKLVKTIFKGEKFEITEARFYKLDVRENTWQAGCSHTSWLAIIKNDLSYHNFSVEDAT